MSETTLPPGAVAQRLHAVAHELVPQMGLEVARDVGEVIFMDVSRTSPKGSVGGLGRRGTSVHPGKYAASHKASLNRPAFAELPDRSAYPRLGVTEILPVLGEMGLGDVLFITNDATSDGSDRGYADILERGRHVDSLGRPAGSIQAPEGIYGPAIERASAKASAIIMRAMRRVVARFTGGR